MIRIGDDDDMYCENNDADASRGGGGWAMSKEHVTEFEGRSN